jgi:hypothetical protein
LTIPVIDCHVHLAPDQVAAKNIEHMTRLAGFKPACEGTVDDLLKEMERGGVARSIVNNIVNDPRLVSKANDWTAKTVAAYRSRLTGLAWIHPQMEHADGEIQRCIQDLGMKGVKLHYSNTKTYPNDPKAKPIYETCLDLDVPLLIHCGPNVEDLKNPPRLAISEQYSRPRNFEPIVEAYPRLTVILAHLAGAQHYKQEAFKLLDEHSTILFDTALGEPRLAQEMIQKYSPARILFGSDYPVVHPAESTGNLRPLRLEENAVYSILHDNAVTVFGIE